jgi:hypothetical protein
MVLAVYLYLTWGMGESLPIKSGKGINLGPSGTQVDVDFTGLTRSFSDGAGFYLCTGDGVRRYDNNCQTVWDYPLNFTNPVFIENNGYVGASEYKAFTYYAFDDSGLIYTHVFDNEILNFSISQNGHSTVVVATDTGYTINVYNKSGTLLKYFIFQDRFNYPIAADISADGKILVVSFLDTSQIEMRSSISAYYLSGDEAIDFKDGLFANFNLAEGQVISTLKFMGPNELLFVSDRKIGCYRASDQSMELTWAKDINNEIEYIGYLNEMTIAVALGKPIADAEGMDEGTLLITDTDGTVKATLNEAGNISYLSAGRDTVIIGTGMGGRKFSGLNEEGSLLWEYESTLDIMDIVTLDEPDKVLATGAGKLAILTRQHGETHEPVVEPEENAAQEHYEEPAGEPAVNVSAEPAKDPVTEKTDEPDIDIVEEETGGTNGMETLEPVQ